MSRAYCAIFDRMGLQYRAVAADSGAIGGDLSQEFQVIADTGEDAIVYCPTSDYAANMELAEAVAPAMPRGAPSLPMARTPTPGKSTCEDVAALLHVPLATTVKSLVLATDAPGDAGDSVADHPLAAARSWRSSLNEVKAGKVEGLKGGFRFATPAEIEERFGCKPGYLGPVATAQARQGRRRSNGGGRCATSSAAPTRPTSTSLASTGAATCPSQTWWPTSATWSPATPLPTARECWRSSAASRSATCSTSAPSTSTAMNATYLDENGKPQLMEMGCYGIGITRLLGAAIEQNHDERGIIWPDSMAPFTVVLCPIGYDRSPRSGLRRTACTTRWRASGST